jgi:hypothetical protein
MRKLFFAICFSIFTVSTAVASVTGFVNADAAERRGKEKVTQIRPEDRIPQFRDRNDFVDYLQKRASTVAKSRVDENMELVDMYTMDTQHSEEYIAQQGDKGKSTFQRIYESALERSGSDNEAQTISPAQIIPTNREDAVARAQKFLGSSDLPLIRVPLPPYGTKVLVPAEEHIPYFFSDIVISPSGMININETITVVANGKKLKNGLVRAIPKYSVSRSGEKNKINVSIISVKINEVEIPYKVEETSGFIVLSPKDKKLLAPGVYTYNIDYTVDRRLWYYDDFNEFYWDVTGSNWNMVISRIGASVSLPEAREFLGHSVLMGYRKLLGAASAVTIKGSDNNVGFLSVRPLFVGEGLHIITSFGKEGFEEPGVSKKFDWFIEDYGTGLFALMGLLAIAISYYLSWKDMNSKNTRTSANMRKNAPMLRYLLNGIFDKISFGAFLLELFRKNIIDIQKEGENVVLIKKTDNLSSLNRNEKKALSNLFLNKEPVLNINKHNMLKIKRAYSFIENDIVGKFKNFTLKLNFGYLFFSVGMLVLSCIFMAINQVEFGMSLFVLLTCAVWYAASILIYKRKMPAKWMNNTAKVVSVIMGAFGFFVLSVFFSWFSALMILLMVVTIFVYTKLFATRSGLVKNNIEQAENIKEFLVKNKETISLGRDFLAQQPSIYALDLSSEYVNNNNIKDYYRIDIIQDIMKLL